MAGFSTHLAQALINHVFRGQNYAAPNGIYLALFVADPTDNNITANEVTGAWYGRQSVNSWAAPTGTAVSTANSNRVVYNAVSGSAVTVTHWGLYDAATSGNLLASGAWTQPKLLNIDDVLAVNANDLTLAFE